VETSAGSGCLVVFLALIIVGAVGSILNHSENGAVSSPTVNTKSTALSQVSLDFKWRKEGFENVMEADFTVKNDSNYDIKDLEITCHHFAKSGTEIDRNTRTIYDVVKAHSTKKFQKFNMGLIHTQAEQSSCAVTNLSNVQ
jgi:archaellin